MTKQSLARAGALSCSMLVARSLAHAHRWQPRLTLSRGARMSREDVEDFRAVLLAASTGKRMAEHELRLGVVHRGVKMKPCPSRGALCFPGVASGATPENATLCTHDDASHAAPRPRRPLHH